MRFQSRWHTYLQEKGLECAVLSDGRLETRMPYLDERWMAHEILRHLGDAVLERPASARKRVRELAAMMAERYTGDAR